MPKETKTARINIKAKPSEKAALVKKANRANMTLSRYLIKNGLCKERN